MATETLIRIKPDQPEVSVEQINGNLISRKLVQPESIAKCFLKSKFDSERCTSGLLPAGCIAVVMSSREVWYFLEHPERHADICSAPAGMIWKAYPDSVPLTERGLPAVPTASSFLSGTRTG